MNKNLYLTNNYISDLRTIKAETINTLDIQLENKDYFITNMTKRGYQENYVNVLVKNIQDYEINVNIDITDVAVVNNIIAYQDNVAVDLPQEVLDEVVNDINECNQ